MRPIKFLLLILIFAPLSAHADIAVLKWKEVSQLTEYGKKTVISIEARVKDIPRGQAMSAFSIGFDSKQDISIISVSFEGRSANYDFTDNMLKVKFLKAKASNEIVSLKLIYKERHKKINQYLRQESINVPKFAVGATASVIINFPGYELTTYTRRAMVNGNNFNYTAVVPEDGISESIKFTKDEAQWDIKVEAIVASNKALGELSVKVPSYFNSSRQKVKNKALNFSAKPIHIDRKKSGVFHLFRVNAKEFDVSSTARILTGKNYRKQVFYNMINYTQVSQEERILLTPLLQKVKANKEYAGLPIYVAIGEFVKSSLKYDKKYIGKLSSLSEIIKNEAGVCVEFAKLYDGLARLAGIPSMIIDGAACGEYDKCQGHSWNMIFYGGRWIEVDPTWGLMSGIVSSSHIYVSDGGKGGVEIKYPGRSGNVSMEVNLGMTDVNGEFTNTEIMPYIAPNNTSGVRGGYPQ